MNDDGKVLTVEEAVNFLKQYKQESGKTQAAIAKELAISESALSSFLSGTYKTPLTICDKVAALQKVNEKKKVAPKAPGYAPTTIAQTVINAIRYSHIQGKISIIYGDAGVGKTMAAKQYLKENSLAVGIEIDPTYASITGVNELIAEQLGIRERVARKITREIIGRLKESGRVLIVDEAQFLTVRTLDHLRCISDKSGIGITFIGNEAIYNKMKGTSRSDFAQLFSRIGMRKQILTSHITQGDVKAVFGQYDIDENAMDVLYRICRTNYGLRGAVNVYVNTAAVFQEVTDSGVARVMKDMNIGA